MTLDEALEYVAEGGKVTSASLSNGAVLKQEGDKLRVVFELTGDSYDFQNHDKDKVAEWHKVEGWSSYG